MAHWDTCGAPICAEYGGDGWYPEEDVCNLRPYTAWQKSQVRIQKLYNLGKVKDDRYFTKAMLETMQRVRAGVKGTLPSDGPMDEQPSFHPEPLTPVVSAVVARSGIKTVVTDVSHIASASMGLREGI